MNPRVFQLFAGSASQLLAQEIAKESNRELGKVEISRFSDGELQPCFGESIRGSEVYIVQSTYAPAENIVELLLMIDAAKRASANSITVVIPYFGYGRQDRKDRPRVSIGSKLMADVLEAAGAARVVTMDLHAGQIQGFFNIPVDNLEASPIFIDYLNGLSLENLVIASPDMGGVVRARSFAKHLHAELALVDKRRVRANQIESMQIIGDVKDKNVVIVDDIVDTAGTLCKAADLILENGARSVRAAITHPILSGSAVEKIQNSNLTEVIVTNTIPRTPTSKIKILSVAPIFAKALQKIYQYESVSSLFLS